MAAAVSENESVAISSASMRAGCARCSVHHAASRFAEYGLQQCRHVHRVDAQEFICGIAVACALLRHGPAVIEVACGDDSCAQRVALLERAQ
jgi:hypothetical protein